MAVAMHNSTHFIFQAKTLQSYLPLKAAGEGPMTQGLPAAY
jgi:hypothetical protein